MYVPTNFKLLSCGMLLLISVMFSLYIIITYWVNNKWNETFDKSDDVYLKKILMSIHYICGMYCMIMFCVQKLIVGMKVHKHNTVGLIHASLGVTIYMASIIMALCGISYIYIYNTIGGIFMSFSFCIYGLLMIFVTMMCILLACDISTKHPILQDRTSKFINAYLADNATIHEKNIRLKTLIKQHHIFNNIYGSLLFGALFYRVLYIYAANMQYPLPTNHNDYNRTIDLIFLTGFFIPSIAISIYSLFSHKRFKILRYILRLIMSGFLFSTIVVFCLYYFNKHLLHH